jgi:hypothetical protein
LSRGRSAAAAEATGAMTPAITSAAHIAIERPVFLVLIPASSRCKVATLANDVIMSQ